MLQRTCWCHGCDLASVPGTRVGCRHTGLPWTQWRWVFFPSLIKYLDKSLLFHTHFYKDLDLFSQPQYLVLCVFVSSIMFLTVTKNFFAPGNSEATPSPPQERASLSHGRRCGWVPNGCAQPSRCPGGDGHVPSARPPPGEPRSSPGARWDEWARGTGT